MTLDPQIFQLLGRQLDLAPAELATLQAGDYAQFVRQRLAADPSLASDPMVSALMSGLAQTGKRASAAAAHELDQEIATEVSAGRRADELAERAMHALDYVASIVGACRCWGEDELCPRCDGHGRPGFRRPRDVETFLAWIRPNLNRMGLRLVRAPAADRGIKQPSEG